ncbi:MAG: lipopolysaccharide biosynthesis protein [Bradymonadia bacterium]
MQEVPKQATTDQSAASDDRSELRRGVIVNGLGYLPKLAVPVLLVLVIRTYGADAFGLFTFAQAVLLFVCRIALLGFDKGILWWTPQQDKDNALTGFAESFTINTLIALCLTALIAGVLAPSFATWGETPEATQALRLMSCALIPMVMMELFLASTMGLKRMEPNVLVRETLLPIANVGLALLLAPFTSGVAGLAIAFVTSYALAALVSFAWWRRLHGRTGPLFRFALPPTPFIRYSLPMWLAEMANSFQQRMDTYFITAYLDLRLLGIYAAVVQIANAIRSIRRSFDPIVLVIASEIGSKNASERLRSCYSYATYLVTATQLPVLVFVIVFAHWLMPLFGDGFEAGVTAVIVLCSFWVFNSPFSLAGIVVSAYGYSGLALLNVGIGILGQAICLWWLVPLYGLNGAATAVGLGYTLLSLVQVGQMRWVTGQWNCEVRVLIPAFVGLTACVVGFACWHYLLVENLNNSLVARVGAFLIFLGLYGSGLWLDKRRERA